MASLWRVQKNTDTNGDVGEYCIEHKVVAMGWSLNDNHLEEHWKNAKKIVLEGEERKQVINRRNSIKTFEEYESFLAQYGIYNGKVNSSVNALKNTLTEDDLIWMRHKGIYYLARVTADSKWVYNSNEDALSLDASNQLSNVEWIAVGDESCVPGAVANAMIKGKTLQHIRKEGMLEFSQLTYNSIAKCNHYNAKMEKQPMCFIICFLRMIVRIYYVCGYIMNMDIFVFHQLIKEVRNYMSVL